MIGVRDDLIQQCLISKSKSHTHSIAPTYLNPVIVGISKESNVLHATVGQLLDKLDAKRLETLTGLFDIIHKDGSMAETTAHLGVAVSILEIRLILGAPVAM